MKAPYNLFIEDSIELNVLKQAVGMYRFVARSKTTKEHLDKLYNKLITLG